MGFLKTLGTAEAWFAALEGTGSTNTLFS